MRYIKLGNWAQALCLPGLITALVGCASNSDSSPVSGDGGPDPLARPCTPYFTLTAPSDELLTTFAGASGKPFSSPYNLGAFPGRNQTAPDYTLNNGVLHITLNRPALAQEQYLGVLLGIGFCIDATAYTGVSFSISGSFSGCSMQYLSVDDAHQDMTTGGLFATGPTGAYSLSIPIPANRVTTIPQTIEAAFAAQSGGNPPVPTDKSKLILFVWQFAVPRSTGAATDPCIADISISDVKFYR